MAEKQNITNIIILIPNWLFLEQKLLIIRVNYDE